MKYKIIEDYCQDLQKIYSSTKILLKGNDNFGFFLICYLYKLNQHMDSIRKLCPSPDTQLVARTMIETLIQMLWVAQNPEERSAIWRNYVFIEDWNTLQDMLNRGIPISQTVHAMIEDSYEAKKTDYLTKKKQVYRDWKKGVKIHQMADDVKAGDLYSVLYSGFSDWVHGGPVSLARQVEFTDNLELFLDGNNIQHFVNASFSAAFQCMFQGLQVCTQHFSLGLDEQLQSIYDRYIRELSEE